MYELRIQPLFSMLARMLDSKDKHMVDEAYDRESALKNQLNSFLANELRLPLDDYYSRLDIDGFIGLKSVLSDINNILTLRVSLAFVRWVTKALRLDEMTEQRIISQVQLTKPNSNGYDVELSEPTNIIAEIKCNIPINKGNVYGSAQKNGIASDIDALVNGKNKSSMTPSNCTKFMVFLDRPEVKAATNHFVRNMREHRETVRIVDNDTSFHSLERVNIVFVAF